MPPIHFSIPYIKQLEKEDGWSRDPNSDHKYFVIRCHYMLTEKQSNDPDTIKIGDIIDTITVIPGAPQEKVISREEEGTIATIEESVKEALKENESVLEFVSALSAEAGVDALGKISSELKTTAQSKLKESFKSTFKVQYSETKREKKTNTWKVNVDPTMFEANTDLLIAKAYTGRSYDLYLTYYDYLIIEYKRKPPFGVKLYRQKRPPHDGSKMTMAPNIMQANQSLVTLKYWNLLPDASKLVREQEYKNEVPDPSEITIEDLHAPLTKVVPRHSERTLYDLSEKVFPHSKWF